MGNIPPGNTVSVIFWEKFSNVTHLYTLKYRIELAAILYDAINVKDEWKFLWQTQNSRDCVCYRDGNWLLKEFIENLQKASNQVIQIQMSQENFSIQYL